MPTVKAQEGHTDDKGSTLIASDECVSLGNTKGVARALKEVCPLVLPLIDWAL